MANKISISNLALNHIGATNIQSFEENTKPAITLRAVYENVVEAVLRDHNWSFARKIVDLAETTDEIDGYDFAYAYPSDCIEARYIYDPSDRRNREIEFIVGADANLSKNLILTDQCEAKLVYTARVTNSGLFDGLFVDALAFRLAADLAVPLKGKLDLQRSYMQQYNFFIENAKATSSNENFEDPDDSSSFTDARN